MIPDKVPALSIRQPWANAIIHLGKDIENRSWPTDFRGRVLIHASKTIKRIRPPGWVGVGVDVEQNAFNSLVRDRGIRHQEARPGFVCSIMDAAYKNGNIPYGGIIGEAEIVDCVSASSSPWFVGPYGFVLRNVKPLPFTPCVGRLGFFYPKL